MHVNFLHPFFKAKVDCDVVTSDGYSVSNLVSLDFRERSLGFLAAHFIKPPALLLFQLPFPIHVESMIIKPKVGSQVSSGIAVMVAGIATKGTPTASRNDASRKSTQLFKKKRINKREISADSHKAGAKQEGNTSSTSTKDALIQYQSYELDVTPSSVKDKHLSLFTQVAWLNGKDGRIVHLQNQMFQERSPIQGLKAVETSDIQSQEFQRLYSLQKVTHVVLKITRLAGSSVPAIGRVEIWGQPSASCKPEILEYALGIQERIQGSGKSNYGSSGLKHPCSRTDDSLKNRKLLSELSCYKDSIPEDFLDPITCDIMTIPLLLPSGHNIDTVTLEKHVAAERSWGRLPSDPFTGKLFSTTCKPVPNSALKVRIDKFLLTGGVNTSALRRTVGRDTNLSRESTGSSLKIDNKVLFKESVNCGRSKFMSSQELFDVKCGQRVVNSNLSVSEHRGKIISVCGYHMYEPVSTPLRRMPYAEVVPELGHEEAVCKSLDSALHQTLQGLQMFTRKRTDIEEKPTFTRASITQSESDLKEGRKRTAPQPSEILRNKIKKKSTVLCVSCNQDLSDKSIFHLPCQHVMCRSCLLLATQQKDAESLCNMCKARFRQMDVVRVHNI